MGVGNLTNLRDVSDIRPQTGPSGSKGYKSGRRVSAGSTSSAGGPGVKEQHLTDARASNKAHVKAFRSGNQDARGATKSGRGPTGAVSRHVQTTRRRGSGPSMRLPSPSGGA